jgi:L-rhamnose mutarotase
MRRFAMACRVHPDKRDEYLRLHADVWPTVERTITDCGIRNFTIFVRGDVLFGYYEYVGEDHSADQAKMAADPQTQRWWAFTDPCQFGFDDDAPDDVRWQELDEVWHLD